VTPGLSVKLALRLVAEGPTARPVEVDMRTGARAVLARIGAVVRGR
jgi:hypothetical protein